MIVLIVVAVGLLALSGVQTSSSRDVFSTGRRTRALALAQQRMEVSRASGYLNAVSDSGSADGFQWRAVVDSVEVGLHQVTVAVTWTESTTPDTIRYVNLLSAR